MFEPNYHNDELPVGSEYATDRDDENLPEASTTDPARILESDDYEVYKNVPVFVEHTRTLKSGRELRFGRDELEALAKRSNRRIDETGDFAPVVIGHTNPDPAAPEPPKIGWAGPFRLGWLTKDHTKYAVLADFRIEKDKTKLLNKYPRRSAELWAEDKYEDMYLDPISLLGADTPWSDMGVLYCKQGDGALEKIYYSITPQAPGAYGTGLPQPVVIKNAPEPKREKEKYAMDENNNDYEEPKTLNQDQKNVANAIIGAIFDSPEFKFLRKMMESDAAKEKSDEESETSENTSESAVLDQNQSENGDSEEISEKNEKFPDSVGNNQGESVELSGENAPSSEDDAESDEFSGEEEESEPDAENDDDDESGSDDEEDEDEDLDEEIERLKQESGLSEEEFAKIDAMDDDEFERFLQERFPLASEGAADEEDSEPDSDEEEEGEENAGDDEEEDSEKYERADSGNPYMSKTLDELEEYLDEKYGEELPAEGTPEFNELATDLGYLAYLIKFDQEESEEEEENGDDSESESEFDPSASGDSKDGERVQYNKFGESGVLNPFMDRTIDELERYLHAKYGGTEPPKAGTPEFNELANDPGYLAFFIKINGIGEDAPDDEDEDSDPYGVNETWNAEKNEEDSTERGAGLDEVKNVDHKFRDMYEEEGEDGRKGLDGYYRWKYSINTSPYAQFEDPEEMTPREYYSRKGRDENGASSYAEEKTETNDGFDPKRLIAVTSDLVRYRRELADLDPTKEAKKVAAISERCSDAAKERERLLDLKCRRDRTQALKYSKAGKVVCVFDPDYDGALIWTDDATRGERLQTQEFRKNDEWREAARKRLGCDVLTKTQELDAFRDHLADLAQQGVWWATNPKNHAGPEEFTIEEIDDDDELDDESGTEEEIDETERLNPVGYDEDGDPVFYNADKSDPLAEEDDGGYDVTKDPAFADFFVSNDEEDDDEDFEDEEDEEESEDDNSDAPVYRPADDNVAYSAEDEEIEPDYSLVDEEGSDEEEDAEDDSDEPTDVDEEEDDEEEEDEDVDEEENRPVEYSKKSGGDVRSRDELLGEIDSLQNRIKQLEQAFDWTTEKVVSAERYAKLHDLRSRYIFDEAEEREKCRYFKMSDEQFENRCVEIQKNYRRVPTGIEVPPGLVGSAPADANRPGAVQYAKEESDDFERKVAELAEDYAARGIYKPSDEIRAEVAAKNQKPPKSDQ